jgi:hypothetical protein
MTTTITRKHTVVVESSRAQRLADLDRNYRGQRQFRNQARAVPTELSLSEFDPQMLDLSGLQIVGIKVVHFAQGLGATIDVYGLLPLGDQPMHCTLHLGDVAHRFEAKSVEAWVKSLGLHEAGRTAWQTSRKTGDVYETISFGSVAATMNSDDAFCVTGAEDAF